MRTRAMTALTACLALALMAETAMSTSTTSYELQYTTTTPSSSAGFDYASETTDPAMPGGTPQAVRELKVKFHPGTRFDTRVPPVCRASDADFRDRGERACPISSEVGSGEAVVVSGFGPPVDPIKETIKAFNA